MISKMTAKNILKDAGAERVSDDAAVELADVVNKFAYGVAKKAVKLAAHAKRTTIKRPDIDLAK
ncbi:MAG: NFYB/HAP3 family transcription factor subunit [Candidatus Marsarchaeota archaeon]|jgi:histone H3/H4|nr:NFYB/HAP3 family transcription factor subunit [Candidatus Marsarchaeota archaeon]